MPTESTKAAVQQLRDAGYDGIAECIRELVLHVEAGNGSCSVGLVEWRPEQGQAQLLIRLGGLNAPRT